MQFLCIEPNTKSKTKLTQNVITDAGNLLKFNKYIAAYIGLLLTTFQYDVSINNNGINVTINGRKTMYPGALPGFKKSKKSKALQNCDIKLLMLLFVS